MNPVFLEVKRYFSPEFHEKVLATIEEFVGVSRCILIPSTLVFSSIAEFIAVYLA